MNAEVDPKVAALIIGILVVVVGIFLYVKTSPRVVHREYRGMRVKVVDPKALENVK